VPPLKPHKLIAAVLSLCLVLSSCSSSAATSEEDDEVADVSSEDSIVIEAPEDETENEGYSEADNVFTLNYDSTASPNPLYGMNTYNNDIFSLVYEGLFKLNSSLEPEPVLCDSYTTDDGITFTFKLKSGVKFHDGKTLTASDVEYTINRAAGSPKYSSRFKSVIAVNAKDDETLVIILSSANYSFPALLDVPIIESGAGDESSPAGTGPYVLKTGGRTSYLSAFSSYRDYSSLPIDTIYLTELEPLELSENFSSHAIDLISYDPTGIMDINVHSDYETRHYATTNLVYIGFNLSSGITANTSFRNAIRYLVDTNTIYNDIYSSAATLSPLILSPVLSYYDSSWADGIGYSRQSFGEYITEAGFSDWDNDGFLESPTYGKFTITIIVNSESTAKVEIANLIATELKNNGISAEVIPLQWTRYVENLTAGTFNLYIGEARIPADFDLSSLLTTGGSLNYGSIDDDQYKTLIKSFLGASEEDKSSCAKELCDYVSDNIPIIPILYKDYAVISHIGVVSDLVPSLSGIFSGISSCTINLNS
jgi:ABC-type transport system substrate-binding protein